MGLVRVVPFIIAYLSALAIVFLLCPSPAHAEPVGALNPAVTQATVGVTACVPGWSGTVRPKVGYANKVKALQMDALGLPGHPSDYEEDHFIPLALGGSPSAYSPDATSGNLWPQPWLEARRKDVIETRLHRELCHGAISLRQAQEMITHWREEKER